MSDSVWPVYYGPVSTKAAIDIAQVHRLSTHEYHQLVESGGLDEDARVELIGAGRGLRGPDGRAGWRSSGI